MHWKIKRDPFYSRLFEENFRGKELEELVEEGGFFLDKTSGEFSIEKTLDIFCTPVTFLKEKLRTAKNPAVLLTTGSFCPIHDGHVEMMLKAREVCESRGIEIIGGYIAPDHDEYVGSKVKEKWLPIHQRIRKIHEKVKGIEWLKADPWAGLFCKHALNFTDIYLRLFLYLKKHLGKEIPVYFVCGGDNARFSLAFRQSGKCIVIDRPGNEEKVSRYKSESLYAFNDNALSSTLVRKNEEFHEKRKILHLRIDKEDSRQEKIVELLRSSFSEIRISHLSTQLKSFSKLGLRHFISMDSLTPSLHNLQISRKYDVFGIDMLGFTNRPGSVSLAEQVASIPEGEYFLFDDDIHTGRTVKFAKDLLKKSNIAISGLAFYTSTPDEDEVLDCRDFYFGEENCGLVVEFPDGKIERMPYVYPTVCPHVRGSIRDPLNFSKEVWKINMDYFRLKDREKYLVCKSHYELFTSLL